MAARQLIQFVIYPKLFRSIDIYCKGRYHLSFKIYHTDEKGVKKYAHPSLAQCNSSYFIKTKKASVDLEANAFQTQYFYVAFNDENFQLKSICTFILQYDREKIYQTYLEVSLHFTHTLITKKNPEQEGLDTISKDNIHFCQKKTLCINNLSSFLQLSQVKFTDISYTSMINFYFGCFNLGYRIRKNQYQLSQFAKLKPLTVPIDKPTKYQDTEKIGKKIKKIFHFENINVFYVCIVIKILKVYQDSIRLYNQLVLQGNQEKYLSQKNNLCKVRFQDLSGIKIPKQLRNFQYFCSYYQVQTQNQLYFSLYQESQLISKNVKFVWEKIIGILPSISSTIYINNNFREQKNTSVLKQLLIYDDWMAIRSDSIEHFKSLRSAKLNKLNLFDIKLYRYPMIRLFNYQHKIQPPQQSISFSLMVLVHGYQGNSSDMERIRNIAKLYCEHTYFLMISSVESTIDDKIDELGKRIAIQVQATIQNSFLDFKRINFIGFSLGGVLCRAALKYLQKYKDKINIMITLGSPHLGISSQNNILVNVGLWYRIKFQNANNLQELSIPDNGSAQQSTMTKLSKYQSLRWLKKLVVASCQQDKMVPAYSAKICQQQKDLEIKKISQNIRMRVKKIQRIDVWFDTKSIENFMDKMIGRRSHIEFLQNEYFLDNLMRIYAKQF